METRWSEAPAKDVVLRVPHSLGTGPVSLCRGATSAVRLDLAAPEPMVETEATAAE
jgi:hypothetical protein